CADLDRECAFLSDHLGAQFQYGGSHPGQGTHNALLPITPGVYLEVLAPDPAQTCETQLRRDLAQLSSGGLIHWAIRCDSIERTRQLAKDTGLAVSDIADGRRDPADGGTLRWRLFGLTGHELGGAAPFFIEWLGQSRPFADERDVDSDIEFMIATPGADHLRPLLAEMRTTHTSLQSSEAPSLTLRLNRGSGPRTLTSPEPFSAGIKF
ncbi:MAG: VOC family protein, partial [Pseudomonadota bacterium]